MLILTGFEDAYYGEPDLMDIPEGQEDAHIGKSAFVDLITGDKLVLVTKIGVCNQIMLVKLDK